MGRRGRCGIRRLRATAQQSRGNHHTDREVIAISRKQGPRLSLLAARPPWLAALW